MSDESGLTCCTIFILAWFPWTIFAGGANTGGRTVTLPGSLLLLIFTVTPGLPAPPFTVPAFTQRIWALELGSWDYLQINGILITSIGNEKVNYLIISSDACKEIVISLCSYLKLSTDYINLTSTDMTCIPGVIVVFVQVFSFSFTSVVALTQFPAASTSLML